MRILDRYVLESWLWIFVLTAIGFPVVSIMINMTDNLERLLDRGLKRAGDPQVSYVYALPENIFLVMPAAVLFATVFTVGNLGRHSELTAAKAGGLELLPADAAALPRGHLGGGPGLRRGGTGARVHRPASSSSRRPSIARPAPPGTTSSIRADQGWVYTIRSLDVQNRMLRQLVFERQGKGAEYPGLTITADSATYDDSPPHLATLVRNQPTVSGRAASQVSLPVHVGAAPGALPGAGGSAGRAQGAGGDALRGVDPIHRRAQAIGQRHQQDRGRPGAQDRAAGHLPGDRALRRTAGGDSSPRQGAAIGIAISLGTTVVFLSSSSSPRRWECAGIVNPVAAAWAPNVIFLAAAVWLLRVRT